MGQKLIIVVATAILLCTGILLGYVLSQLILGFLALNFLTLLGTFSLILIFGTLYYVLFWELRRQQSRLSPQRTKLAVNRRIADNRLKNKLIAILNGDVAMAERLVEQVKQDYPDMPESWYWERVIADVEREQQSDRN
jgi:high-affinity Fe2+/Pb2+ permease